MNLIRLKKLQLRSVIWSGNFWKVSMTRKNIDIFFKMKFAINGKTLPTKITILSEISLLDSINVVKLMIIEPQKL